MHVCLLELAELLLLPQRVHLPVKEPAHHGEAFEIQVRERSSPLAEQEQGPRLAPFDESAHPDLIEVVLPEARREHLQDVLHSVARQKACPAFSPRLDLEVR